MGVDKKLFRALMLLHGDTNQTLAEFLGISEQSLSNKINENGTEFKQGEMQKIRRRYQLDGHMIDRIFFASEVSDLDTSDG
jgi:DNA-binding XRE family transcriptional regulator